MKSKHNFINIALLLAACVATACSASRANVEGPQTAAPASLSRAAGENGPKDSEASKQSLDLAARADSYFAKKEYVQAKALYDRIAGDKKLKNPAAVYNNLALCEWNLRNYGSAVNAWERAIKADSDFTQPYMHLGQLALKSGDYLRAEQMFRKIVSLDSKDLNANLLLGVSLRGKGDFIGAERAYQRVLALDSDNSEALFALAVLYHKFLGRNHDALGYYERFIKLNPEKAKSEKIQQLISQARSEASLKTAQSKETTTGVR